MVYAEDRNKKKSNYITQSENCVTICRGQTGGYSSYQKTLKITFHFEKFCILLKQIYVLMKKYASYYLRYPRNSQITLEKLVSSHS